MNFIIQDVRPVQTRYKYPNIRFEAKTSDPAKEGLDAIHKLFGKSSFGFRRRAGNGIIQGSAVAFVCKEGGVGRNIFAEVVRPKGFDVNPAPASIDPSKVNFPIQRQESKIPAEVRQTLDLKQPEAVATAVLHEDLKDGQRVLAGQVYKSNDTRDKGRTVEVVRYDSVTGKVEVKNTVTGKSTAIDLKMFGSKVAKGFTLVQG